MSQGNLLVQPTARRYSLQFGSAMVLSGTVGLFAVSSGLSAIPLVFFRCLFGAAFLAMVSLSYGKFNLRSISKNELSSIGVAGLALVFNWVCLFQSFQTIPIAVAVSIYYLAPLFVFLYGVVFLGETFTRRRGIAVTLSFIGTVFVTGMFDGKLLGAALTGCVFAFGAAVLYATVIILSRRIKHTEPAVSALAQTVIGVVVLSFLVNKVALTKMDINWLVVIALGVVHTGVLYILFFRSVRYVPASQVAVLSFMDPLVAIGAESLLLGRELTPHQWCGIGLILTGFFISRRCPRKRKGRVLSRAKDLPEISRDDIF